MFKIVLRFLGVLFGLYIASELVPGIMVADIPTAIIVGLVLGAVNLVVRPILVILTLPITILTLGLFWFVLNACIFWFIGTTVDGFSVSGFIPALLGSLIVSCASWIAHKLT